MEGGEVGELIEHDQLIKSFYKMKLLYKPFLYCNEEEVQLYGVLVPNNFWDSENISEKYRLFFEDKLKRSIYYLIEKKLRDELEDNFFEFLAINHDKAGLSDDLIQQKIDPAINNARYKLRMLIEDNFDSASGYFYSNIETISVITNQLMQSDKIYESLYDFCKRLVSIQKTGSILQYYKDCGSFSIETGYAEARFENFDELVNTYYELEFTAFRLDRFIDIDIDFEELTGKYNYLHC
jgi:hypothetical protein